MHKLDLQYQNYRLEHHFQTLAWAGECLVDWPRGGQAFDWQGQALGNLAPYHLAFSFDAAITSPNGQYALVYKRLGTKALLLKNGQPLREINRSYYHAEDYEYPAAFAQLPDGRTLLIHCPNSYEQLDLEEAETGQILSQSALRKPQDYFHSRLAISPCQRYLLSKGWYWHPWDMIQVFDLHLALENPLHLDQGLEPPVRGLELSSASFLPDGRILCFAQGEAEDLEEEEPQALEPGQMGFWDLNTKQLSPIAPIAFQAGNIQAVNEHWAWDLYQYPKLFSLKTGQIVAEYPELRSGEQRSSIFRHTKDAALWAYQAELACLAMVCLDEPGRLHLWRVV